MIIKKRVTVEIESNDLLCLLIDAWYRESQNDSEHGVLWCALSWLPGRSDVEAVKMANTWADNHDQSRIKVAKFRKWLPVALSQALAEFLESKKE